MKYFTTEQLSANQFLTPEGYLLCKDVAIARTGTQDYHKEEIGVTTDGNNGVVTVHRVESEVFHPDCLASFEGKPVTNNHPQGFVTPQNWRDHTVGLTQNVRRNGNYIIADLLITDADAIKQIQDGKREVSCGYDADYLEENGIIKQTNIRGNHVALVDKGRCGAACAIKDHEKPKKEKKMSIWRDVRLALAGGRSNDAMKLITDNMPDDERESMNYDDAMGELVARLDALESRLAKLEGTSDEESEENKEEVRQSEDKALVKDCACKAKNLTDMAAVHPEIAKMVKGVTLDALPLTALDALANAADEIIKQKNNRKTADALIVSAETSTPVTDSSEEFMKLARAHYKKGE